MSMQINLTPAERSLILSAQLQSIPHVYQTVLNINQDRINAGQPGLDAGTVDWFTRAIGVNTNDTSLPATNYIRGVVSAGYLLTTGETVNADALQGASNAIGEELIKNILTESGIPTLNHIINNDARIGLEELGLRLGSWGGSAFYWNQPYGDDGRTIGQIISSDSVQMQTFLHANASAILSSGVTFVDNLYDVVNNAQSLGSSGQMINAVNLASKSIEAALSARGMQVPKEVLEKMANTMVNKVVGEEFDEKNINGWQVSYGTDMVNGKQVETVIYTKNGIKATPEEAEGLNKIRDWIIKQQERSEDNQSITKCFPATTPILLANNTTTPIENIRIGDEVFAFDGDNNNGLGSLTPARVVNLFRNTTTEWLELDLGDAQKLTLTPNHAVLNEFGLFEEAQHLIQRGGEMVNAAGQYVKVKGQLLKYFAATAHLYEEAFAQATYGSALLKPQPTGAWNTYNFEVEHLHTYIAGGMRVHNDCMLEVGQEDLDKLGISGKLDAEDIAAIQEAYANGEIEGRFVYRDGEPSADELEALSQGGDKTFLNYNEEGAQVSYVEGGKITHVDQLNDDNEVTLSTTFDANREITSETSYSEGVITEKVLYNADGSETKVSYEDSKPSFVEVKDEDGNITSETEIAANGNRTVTTYDEDGDVSAKQEFNAEGQLVNNFVVEDEPIAFVDGVAVYDEDTLNSLTTTGETDTSIEGLIANLELSDTQAASLITALETAAVDNVDDVDFYQLEDGRVIITGEDGEVLSTFTPSDDEPFQLTDDEGKSFIINLDPEDGESVIQTPDQYATNQLAQMGSALGLVQGLIGLANWDKMSPIQQLSSVVSIYNSIDSLAGGGLPGDLGLLGGGLNLISAFSGDNPLVMLQSTLSFTNQLLNSSLTNEFMTGLLGAEVVGSLTSTLGGALPIIGMIIAIESGNPFSMASSALQLLSWAVGGIPGVNIICAVIAIVGMLFGMFSDPDQPMREGHAEAVWDENGNIDVITTQDAHGGGEVPTKWMDNLVNGIQDQLAKDVDENGKPKNVLIPARMPSIGYMYDPDADSSGGISTTGAGSNSPGHMVLQWYDENGVKQTRQYDGKGSRNDGETADNKSGMADMIRDFMKHMNAAVVPAWEAATIKEHYLEELAAIREMRTEADLLQSEANALGIRDENGSLIGYNSPSEENTIIGLTSRMLGLRTAANNRQVTAEQQAAITASAIPTGGMPVESVDGLTQTYTAMTFTVDVPIATVSDAPLIDIDGDGYLEETQWVANNQAILSIDANLDGQITAGELLTSDDLSAEGLARNSLDWLDSDSDGQLNVDDPAFAVLRIWVDMNQDGKSSDWFVPPITTASITTAKEAIDEGLDSLPKNEFEVINQTNFTKFTSLVDQINEISTAGAKGSKLQELRTEIARIAGGRADPNAPVNSTIGLFSSGGGGSSLPPLLADYENLTELQSLLAQIDGLLSLEEGITPTNFEGVFTAIQTVMADIEALPETPPTLEDILAETPALATLKAKIVLLNETTTTPANFKARVAAVSTAFNAVSNNAALAPFKDELVLAIQAASTAANPRGSYVTQKSGTTTSADELRTLTQMGISAIDFNQNPPRVIYADGRSMPLTQNMLTGDTLGVSYRAVSGGIMQANETRTGSTVIQNAINLNGGMTSASTTPSTQFDANGNQIITNLRSTTANTVVNHSYQTTTTVTAGDGRLTQGTAGAVLTTGAAAPVVNPIVTNLGTTQISTQTTQVLTVGDPRVISQVGANVNPPARPPAIGFVPLNELPISRTQQVTADMITSTTSGVFGSGLSLASLTALGLGVGVVQTPAVTSTGTPLPYVTPPSTSPLLVEDVVIGSGEFEDETTVLTPSIEFRRVDLGTFTSVITTGGGAVTPPATVTTTIIISQPTVTTTSTPFVPTAVTPVLPVVGDAPTIIITYPTVISEQIAGLEDIGFNIADTLLLANDSTYNPPTGGLPALFLFSVGEPTNGQVSLVETTNADGSISRTVVFIPNTNYHGPASFSYTVSDQYGLKTTNTATLDVQSVNDLPVVTGETANTNEDIGLIFTPSQLLANDTDNDIITDNDRLSIARVSDSQNGTVYLDNTGNVRFIPALNYHGPAQFTYWVKDEFGAEIPGVMKVTVAAVNDAPIATGETLAAVEDTTLYINPLDLLANDSDVDVATDGQVLKIERVFGATHGIVELTTTGEIRFVPDPNFNGIASFSYVVTDQNGLTSTAIAVINVASVNDLPVLLGENVTINEDIVLKFSSYQLLANDSDNDILTNNDKLTISRVSDATNGLVTLDTEGNVQFIPNANYHGAAQFTYWVKDEFGAELSATVNINIVAVNDTPVGTGEMVAGIEDTLLLLDQSTLLANDIDVDSVTDGQVLIISAVSRGINGTVELLSNGQIQFTPDPNFHGVANFTYTVTDQNGLSVDTIAVVNIAAVNDLPVVNGENVSTNEDIGLRFTSNQLLANDTDNDILTDNDRISISRVTDAQNGTVYLDNTGNVRFIPNLDYHGPAQFTYWVKDEFGAEIPGVVKVTVAAVNDAPIATGETLAAVEDTTLYINPLDLLANDSDVDIVTDGQVLKIERVFDATHGQVELTATGEIRFVPDPNFNGVASFSYVVTDQSGLTSIAIAVINVAFVNDLPVVTGENVSTNEDIGLVFTSNQLLANDTDNDILTNSDKLTISKVTDAQNGTVYLDINGDVRFIPNTNYHGPAEFTYWVKDEFGAEIPGVVKVTVAAVNDAPIATGEEVAAVEDTTLYINPLDLLANDSDVDIATDSQVLEIERVFGATHGTVELTSTGEIRFVPDPNFNGVASFSYVVTDQNGLTSTAIAVVNVASVNDLAVTVSEIANTHEDIGLIFTQGELLANDSDADIATNGDSLHVSRVGLAEHGMAFIDAQGNVRFVPDANYHGVAKFTYYVCDQAGAEVPATVTINIAAVNDLPVVIDDQIRSQEDQILYIDPMTLLSNDSDVDTATDGQILTIHAVGNATHGSVTMLESGAIRFISDSNYHGVASFNYQVSDGNGGFKTATAILTIDAVNDAAVAVGETANATEDHALVFSSATLLANDRDVDTAVDGDVLRITRVGNAQHGSVTLDASGNVHFTPDAHYHGPAIFTYWVGDRAVTGQGNETPATVALTIAAVNDLPVVNGEMINTLEDTQLLFNPANLLANDYDADVLTDNNILTISEVLNAKHGTVEFVIIGGLQQIKFTPDSNFFGQASYDYRVSDGVGGFTRGTVSINVAEVNDRPVGQTDYATRAEDTPFTFSYATLLGNDSDVDNDVITISEVGYPSHGTVAIINGQVVFTPEANYFGAASFVYTVSDGRGGTTQVIANLTITSVNDTPNAIGETINSSEDVILQFPQSLLLNNDSDADITDILRIIQISNVQGGTATIDGNGLIEFRPTLNYHGIASFDYLVSDGQGGTRTATTTINLASINDIPIVANENISHVEDTLLTVRTADLLANDSDADHATLTIISVGNASNGTVTLNGDGTISFMPNPDYSGAAAFTYTVSDGAGGFSVGTAYVNVSNVNDAPRLVGENVVVNEDTIIRLTTGTLLANDRDADNDAMIITSVTGNSALGTVSLQNGEVIFTPTLNASGVTELTYTVSDGQGGLSQATIAITVNAVNDVPIGNNELYWGKRDIGYSIPVSALLANDTDVETPGNLTVVGVTNAQHGSVSLFNGVVTFTPEAGYAGRSSFDYIIQDANGGQTTATTQIDYSRVNANPTAGADAFTGYEDIAMSITASQLLSNDSDDDNPHSDLKIVELRNVSHGSASIDAGGNVVFTGTANYHGAASFEYRVTDGQGGSTWATASITLNSVNDAPVVEDIWYGRPIYGYGLVHYAAETRSVYTTDSEGYGYYYNQNILAGSQPEPIYSETQAKALLATNQLYSTPHNPAYGDGYPPAGVNVFAGKPLVHATYYQNGQLRPLSLDVNDIRTENALTAVIGYGYVGGEEGWGNTVLGYSRTGYTSSNSQYRHQGHIVAYDPDGAAPNTSTGIVMTMSENPQHGHAYINKTVPVTTPDIQDHTQAANYLVNDQYGWQYTAHKGDTFTGDESFVVAVTDADGASTYATLWAHHMGSSAGGGGGKKPIVLDLGNDGFNLLNPDETDLFADVNGDNWREKIGWAAPQDAVLAIDINGDGLINQAAEVSFAGYLEGARTDLEGLAAFDTNNDGILSNLDRDWAKFGVAQDKNGNWQQDAGEFTSLDQMGISHIDLKRVDNPHLNNGNFIAGTTTVHMTNGDKINAADVIFAGKDVALPDEVLATLKPPENSAHLEEARLRQMALLFNQVINATVMSEPPLGYVPPANDTTPYVMQEEINQNTLNGTFG